MSGMGAILECGDVYPGGGLLADCWGTAVARGLSGLGIAVDQARLSKLATALQRIRRPNSLAGWVFNGKKMVWQGRPLGDAAIINEIPYSDIAPTPPNPLDPSLYPVSTLPSSITSIPTAEVMPQVSAQTLWQAAQLPGAPPVVVQAASQLPPATIAQLQNYGVSWWQQSLIAGIPNYMLVGMGGVLLLMMAGGRRR